MPSLPNSLLAGRYRLMTVLGEGGMGRVWQARDEMLGRDVALKEITPSGMSATELGDVRERAFREARAIAQVSHPCVVRVYDVFDNQGTPSIVMELIRSPSLHEVLRREGPMSPERAAQIGLHILAGLRAAHRVGILHRDVKPANVLLAPDGRVVLTDFGLATMAGDSALTRTGVVVGSPSYLAPERALDQPADAKSDLWSLGATLYATIEGRPPYDKSTPMATLAALMVEQPPTSPRAGVLQPALTALLQKNPADRATSDHTEALLRAAAAGQPSPTPATPAAAQAASLANLATPVANQPAPGAGQAATEGNQAASLGGQASPPPGTQAGAAGRATAEATQETRTGRPRRRWWIAAAAAVVAAGLGLWPLITTQRTDASVTAAAPVTGPAQPLPVVVPSHTTAKPGVSKTPSKSAKPSKSKQPTTKPSGSAPPAKPTTTKQAGAPAPATTTTPPATATGRPIRNNGTGTCLDLSAGGALQLWQCEGTADQLFDIPGDDTLRVLGKCVQVNGGDDGSRLSAATCSGSPAQRFNLNEASDLVSLQDIKCVDVPDSSSASGVPAQIWECGGTSNQKWTR